MENFLNYDPNDVMTTSQSYPHSPEYEYETYIEDIDFDKERDKDIAEGNGFILGPIKTIKKELKSEDGIFSPLFGQTLSDMNPYADRYKCRCTDPGKGLRGRINAGMRCPECGHICKDVGDNFSYFGWLVLNDPYVIIHPSYYKKIESFLGKGQPLQGAKRTKIENILDITEDKAVFNTGMPSDVKDEPFYGIGMIEFVKRFDEIMDYYLRKKPNKKVYYDKIMEHRDIIFTHSIPVFSTLLRPFDSSGEKLSYEETNTMYRMMHKHVTSINRNRHKIEQNPKIKNHSLYNLQMQFMKLYKELEEIISGKKGDVRCLLGGRYNFSSRNVIVQNPDLRIDEVTLPAIALTVMLEQRIKNILQRFYNLTPADADAEWYKATISPTPKINGIIRSIINDFKASGIKGIPLIINRNPSIAYGSILQVFCVDFTETYTMALPLQPLPLLNADFDGDVLNIMIPVNQTFTKLAWEKFNPRNVMYISRNDGLFNTAVSMQRDTLINGCTLANLGAEEAYTAEDKANFARLIAKKKKILAAM